MQSGGAEAEATEGRQPLCFVLMPFGKKPDGQGGSVEFDAVYEELLAPAVRAAGLKPLRADQELVGGIVCKPMFERLVLADYAVADLTTANPNVFYELGVRHAVRPHSTVLLSAETKRIPFDLAPDRVLPYRLDHGGRPADPGGDGAAITEALRAARERNTDSPVFQLLEGFEAPPIDRLKTDVFRDAVAYSAEAKEKLADARAGGAAAVRAVEESLGPLAEVEAGVLVDLMLSYRATEAWEEMIRLVQAMPAEVRRTALVREQYALALNRTGRGEAAERVLRGVLEDFGPSSETLGLLGRVYKDRWKAERQRGGLLAAGFLEQAIDCYRKGFEADWRDAYPGVNALTLMEVREAEGEEQRSLLPVVRFANRRRIESGAPDYWDQATRLELALVGREEAEAAATTAAALAAVRESWEPTSTLETLAMVREARAARGERLAWADEIERELQAIVEGG